jgi:hypothetical protein
MSTRTLTDYLASLPTVTSNGSEQVPAVKGGDLVNLPSQGRTVVSTLPETLTAGQELFVESGGVISHYIGNASNVPVRVGLDFAQATFVPTFTGLDSGTITTTSEVTVTKVGSFVTVTGVIVLTVGGMLSSIGVTIGTIPAGYRPAVVQTGIFVNGNDVALGNLPLPMAISPDGSMQIFFDPSGLQSGDRTTIIASWTV